MSFRPLSPDGVIYSIRDVEFLDSENQTRMSNLDKALVAYTGIIELRITLCGRLIFTFGKTIIEYDTRLKMGEWYVHQFSLSHGETRLYTNYAAIILESINFVISDRIYNRNRVNIWFGAVHGIYDWYHGYIA